LSLIPVPVFVKGKVAFSGPPKCRQRAFGRTGPFILPRFGGFTKTRFGQFLFCYEIQGGSEKSGIFFFLLSNDTAQLKIIRFD
jgi:hypothetical protein